MTNNSCHNCHGTIVNISKYGELYGASVSWDERQGIKGGQILFHRLSELRQRERLADRFLNSKFKIQ